MEQKERKAIGEHIRQARLRRGWDIPTLAQRASLSPKLLARLETGAAELTTPQLVYLALALRTSTDALLKDELPTDTLQDSAGTVRRD